MSEWIKWNGGECPVHPETIVRVQFRNETRDYADRPWSDEKASEWRWSHRKGSLTNIIAYRIIEEHQPTIAETIRDAAINSPKFLGDVESSILHAFGPNTFFVDGGFNDYLFGTKKEQLHARTFMLLVAEALE